MSNTRPNPYPGPRPFQRGQTLYGRDQELRDLRDLLIAERIVLLYSPSGAGKTSLIQAALIPELEHERFRVLPIMRVGLAGDAPAGANRYVLSALQALEEGLPEPQQLPATELAYFKLGDYLRQRIETAADGRRTVLVFDQFEEILTVDPTDSAAKIEFFRQVGQALRDGRRWALFAMREEFIAGLDAYRRFVPTLLNATFRLDLLSADAALDAIRLPAEGAGVTFLPAAADKLVDDLRTVQVQGPDGKTAAAQGPHVEPVQLQVVCRRLWDGLDDTDTTIDEADVGTVGDVNTALAGYYADSVAAIVGQTGVRERAVRDWVERQLITESGLRGQAVQGEGASQGLDNRAIKGLVDAHLARADRRRGATWYELTHDRLIAPIRGDNEAWRLAHLSTLQRQAALWEQGDRPAGLLLSRRALEDAEAWAAAHDAELEPHERDFLHACRLAWAAAERERRQAERIRWLAIGATITSIVALIALTAALFDYFRVKNEARLSLSRQLAAQSANRLEDQYDLALLLALEANRVASTVEGRGSLLTALEHKPQWITALRGNASVVWSIAFSPDGQTLAAGVEAPLPVAPVASVGSQPPPPALTTQIILWDVVSGRTLPYSPLSLPARGAVNLAFSPDGKMLVAGSADGQLHFWRLSATPPVRESRPGHPSQVNSLAFSRDGRWLASAGKREVLLWDVSAAQPALVPLVANEAVRSLAFKPDSRTLAVGYADGRIVLWDIETRRPAEWAPAAKDSQPNSLAFSPDGLWLAVGRADKTVALYSSAIPRAATTLIGHTAEVEGVAFRPDGQRLASWGRDRTIRLWDVPSGKPAGEPLGGHSDWVWSTAFSPQGLLLASGGADGGLILWNAEARTRLGCALAGSHGDEVWALALSHDGRWLASTSKDRSLALWDVAAGQAITWTAHTQPVRTVAFSPDDRLLASGGQEGRVILWDIAARATGQPPAKAHELIHTEGQFLTGVAFSPDGRTLASSSFDKTIRLWDLRASPPTSRTLTGHPGQVWSIAFSPDGRTLVSGDDVGSILRWDVATGKPAGAAMTHEGGAYSVAFSPDGKRIASGGPNKQIIVWDAQTGQAVHRLGRHTDTVASVAFAPGCGTAPGASAIWCGGTLASASYDGTVILWDVATGRMIGQPLRGHGVPVNGVAWSGDGKLLADASDDRTVMAWNLDFSVWQAQACRVANRNLTKEEWGQYLGNEAYRETCPVTR